MKDTQFNAIMKAFGDLHAIVATMGVTLTAVQEDIKELKRDVAQLKKIATRHTREIKELRATVAEHTVAINELRTTTIKHTQMFTQFQTNQKEQTEILMNLAQHIDDTATELLQRQRKDAIECNTAHQNTRRRLLTVEKKLHIATL